MFRQQVVVDVVEKRRDAIIHLIKDATPIIFVLSIPIPVVKLDFRNVPSNAEMDYAMYTIGSLRPAKSTYNLGCTIWEI